MKLVVVSIVLASTAALASPRPTLPADLATSGHLTTASACGTAEVRCHAHVVTGADGAISEHATPQGYGADDVEDAYRIDPGAQAPATVAIVDAYGYRKLESDLGRYRAQYGLPPCTVANGCLVIVNQQGQTSPLPPESPAQPEDWTLETALDVDMVSAACPACRIVVVESDDSAIDNLFAALLTAVALQPDVVTNSWGIVESGVNLMAAEGFLADTGGVAVFASSGDDGFQLAGQGPQYPSTSRFVISVGGTVLAPAANARGWSETAWERAGSSCSDGVAPLATQATSACAHRASADISAIAGEPGLAVYNQGAWVDLLGTSAAAPLVAAMFAASGNGGATPDAVSRMTSALTDVVAGANGTCATELCVARAGWDGPTGYGTPIADALEGADEGPAVDESATVTSPSDGDTVQAGFVVELDVVGALDVVVGIDGVQIGESASAPYRFATPADLAPGAHEIEVVATDASGAGGSLTLTVTVEASDVQEPAPASGAGGCNAGGGAGIVMAWYVALASLWCASRSRRRSRRRMSRAI